MVLPSSGNPRRKHGPLVKWLRQRPLTPLTSVRIRYGSPFLKRLDNLIKVCYCTKAVTIQQLVLIRARVHPFPSRTRKLSSLLPTILGWRRPGKIGSANTERSHSREWLLFFTLRQFRAEARNKKPPARRSCRSCQDLVLLTKVKILLKPIVAPAEQ